MTTAGRNAERRQGGSRTFCQIMRVMTLPMQRPQNFQRKAMDMAGEGCPPCSWYTVHTGESAAVTPGALNCWEAMW